MRAYEVMVILDPSLEERTIEPSLDKYLNVIRKDGGSVENVDVWGRRRLAYEVKKNAEGIYAIITLSAEPATVFPWQEGCASHLSGRIPASGFSHESTLGWATATRKTAKANSGTRLRLNPAPTGEE